MAAAAGYAYRQTGRKEYEPKDQLGNVRVVVGDGKPARVGLRVRAPGDTLVNLLLRTGVRSQSHYYPCGMTQPGGSYAAQGAAGYRYGFTGKEKDSEVKGDGDNHVIHLSATMMKLSATMMKQTLKVCRTRTNWLKTNPK